MCVAQLRSGVAVLVLAAFVAPIGPGCSHTRPSIQAMSVDDVVPTDRIGVDDVFEVRVFGEADLTGSYRVASDGTIDFPLAGQIDVSGISTTELQRLLVKKLREGYLKNPQVSVMMKEWNSRKISVLGQVKNPGAVPYRPNMTIVDAIVSAGGFTPTADKNSVNLRREGGGGKVQNRVFPVASITEGQAPNVQVIPGDVLVVGERLF